MADILLISVSKDASRTDALAARFQKAGLSIGDAFSRDPALHLAAAGVLVWSENSHHSLFFRDAASRLLRGGAAIVANLTDVPPPAYFDSSLNFDLSGWQGDPCDPALDPLAAAIQQMVVNDLCAQAACWRSIRGSRDPSPLLDYLARYGPDGAFSALVEKRLERLALEQRPQPRVLTTALVLAPAAGGGSTFDEPSPAPNPAASLRASPPPARSRASSAAAARLLASPAASHPNAARPKPAAAPDAKTPKGRRTNAAPTLRARIMLPLLIGAALVGAAYFGALGVSKYVFGPTESLAAPSDPPVVYLHEPAPAQPAAEPLLELSPAQPAQGADQVTPVVSGELRSIPHMTSPESSETSAALTLLDAPAIAPLGDAGPAASTEAVEAWGGHGEGDVVAAPVPEVDTSVSLDGAADPNPMVDVEAVAVDGAYGPQP